MKTSLLLTVLIPFVLCSCTSGDKANPGKISFGIYETVRVAEIPVSITEMLKTTSIQFESDTLLPIIGYFLKTDTTDFPIASMNENIKLIRTVYTVDKEGKYIGLVAARPDPVINIEDIQKTKVTGKDVEIHFNMDGAKKWASMTKNNVGNHVALVMDNEVYDLPVVNAEIKSGVALIRGIENETIAKKLSDSLNSNTR